MISIAVSLSSIYGPESNNLLRDELKQNQKAER